MSVFDTFSAVLTFLNTASPFGVLAAVCFMAVYVWMVKGKIDTVTDNHLSHVQVSLDKLVDLSEEQRDTLNEVRDNTSYLRGKLDR